MPLNLVTPPATAIISTDDAKAHLRVTSSADDVYIDGLVGAISAALDGKGANILTGRALITQTWDYYLDAFPACEQREINFPLSPIQSVTYIKYYDSSNILQTIDSSNYVLDTYSAPSRIQPAYGTDWPAPYPKINAVIIRAVCGYGSSPSSIPANIIHAAKILLSYLYDNRGSDVETLLQNPPGLIKGLLSPHRIQRF